MFRLALIIFAAILAISDAEFSTSQQTLNCAENYLEIFNDLDASYILQFNSFPAVAEAECQSILKNLTEDFIKSVIEKQDNAGLTRECFVNELKKEKIENFVMKKILYEYAKNLNLTAENEKEVSIIINVSRFICDENRYENDFDEVFQVHGENHVWSHSELMEKYCVRKRIVDKKFIDTNLYKVNFNPGNIEIDNIDCDKIIETILRMVESTIVESTIARFRVPSENADECAKSIFRKFEFFDWINRVNILGELKVSNEVKVEERKKFVEQAKKFHSDIMKC
jgi:hypothetical protein